MRIYLHIGTGKTGTTTLQVSLEQNRALLAANNVWLPTTLGRQNHRHLTAYALNDDVIENLRRSKRLTDPERLSVFRKKVRKNFAEEAGSWPSDATVVMTSEQMTRLHRPGEVARLRDLLSLATTDVKVVAYLRRQDEYFVSEYSQLIKGGETPAFTINKKVNMKVYNYDNLLREWANVFGAENVIVRPFEREQLHEKGLVADFLSVIEAPDMPGFVEASDQNLSLDVHTVEFLRLVNPFMPRWVDGRQSQHRLDFVRLLESISTAQKPRCSPEDARTFLARFEQSNADVARRYLGREDGILFRTTPSAQGQSPSLTPEGAGEIVARLWHAHAAKVLAADGGALG